MHLDTVTPIRLRYHYTAPPRRVFDAWLAPEVAGRWLFATASRPLARAAIDARVGGSFCFVERQDGEAVEHSGEYIEIAPPRRLVFALAARCRTGITRVTVEIAPSGLGSELYLTHEMVPQEQASRIERRWSGILYGLGVVLEVPGVEFTRPRPTTGNRRTNDQPREMQRCDSR